MRKKTELTQLEKILLDHFITYPEDITFQDCFILSHDTSKINPALMAQSVSKWKKTELVQTYLKQSETKKERMIKNRIEERLQTNENGERVFLQDTEVNFTNISEFIAYLNTKANNLTDEKERQKYLQMLSDLLRFKDQDTKENDIIRFYMPLKCCNCPKNKP